MNRLTSATWAVFVSVAFTGGSLLAQAIPDESMAWYRKALAMQKAGRAREAIKAYEAGMRIADLPETRIGAQIQYNLAILYKDEGQFARAEKLFLKSLAVREKVLDEGDLNLAWSSYMLGLLYRDTWDFTRSEKYFKRSLKIRKAAKGQPGVAQSLLGLATLYDSMTDYTRAEPAIQQALDLAERERGRDHPFVAEILLAQAGIYRGMGNYKKAIPRMKRALEIYELKNGKDHLDTALAINNLAVLYLDIDNFSEAEKLHKRALKIRAEWTDKTPAAAQSLNNLGEVYRRQGEYAQALPYYRRALKTYTALFGANHPITSQTLNNIAATLLGLGEWKEAEKYLRASLADMEKRLPPEHADFTVRLHNLALIGFASDQLEQGVKAADRQRHLVRQQVGRLLPAMSEREQLAYLRDQDGLRLRMALSGGLLGANDSTTGEKSASWLLNAKGLAHQALAESALRARDSKDPELGKLTAQLLSVRQRLGKLTLTQPRAGQENQVRRLAEELSTREEDLSKRLRKLGSNAAGNDWVETAEVRRSLPRGGVFIDIARFDVYDYKANAAKDRWLGVHYVAWLTPKEGKIQLVDLGRADAIDKAIEEVRREMAAGKAIKEKGDEIAEKALRKPLEKLSELVLRPLLPHLAKTTDLLVSPDGNLWLVPWEALLLPDGRYAVEKYQLSYLTSGRDLPARPSAVVKPSRPLVLADPDFDLTGEEEAETNDKTRALPRSLRLGKIPRLPGTAAEAKAITSALQAFAGEAPAVHTGKGALKSVFQAVKHPRVVVLCTHGFFLADQPISKDDRPASREKKALASERENPLLRCGLLLAGCNQTEKASASLNGVLTGLEVVSADLRGCELVVLSACETGLGDLQIGEGVSGLRQAFQLAGAQAVVSTLWQVPDKPSARLMALFFRNLGKGQGKAEALRAAQLKIIAERRDDFAAAHPFFWAAYTLTGR